MSRHFHVCDVARRSGISRYAQDFHQAVLGPLGYELIGPAALAARLPHVPSDAVFHFQMGAAQFEERIVLSRTLDAGFTRVDATLHDPPFLTFPFYPFRSPHLMRLSRVFDWALGSFGVQRRTIARLRTAFVLSEKGKAILVGQGARNITHIPHIIRAEDISWKRETTEEDLLYFGFIGRGKGLEYALALHERLLSYNPRLKLHVIGEATGAGEKAYFRALRARYARQTVFHGYVNDEQLDPIFARTRHVVLPFKPYRYFTPMSGSVLNALRRGRVVWTTPVNAIPELIRDGDNGFFLEGDLDADAARLHDVSHQPDRLEAVSKAAIASAVRLANYPYREVLSRSSSSDQGGTFAE